MKTIPHPSTSSPHQIYKRPFSLYCRFKLIERINKDIKMNMYTNTRRVLAWWLLGSFSVNGFLWQDIKEEVPFTGPVCPSISIPANTNQSQWSVASLNCDRGGESHTLTSHPWWSRDEYQQQMNGWFFRFSLNRCSRNLRALLLLISSSNDYMSLYLLSSMNLPILQKCEGLNAKDYNIVVQKKLVFVTFHDSFVACSIS